MYVVRKWPLRGISRFVCWNITQVSLWLLCNVHFMQSKQRTRLQTRPFVRSIYNLLKLGVCASRNQAVAHYRVENLNIVSMCAVSPVVHTSNISYLLTYLLHGAESFLRSSLVCSQSRNSPHFTEPEGSLTHSQASATYLYPGPAQSSPYTHIPPPGDPS